MSNTFEELEVWQLGRDLTNKIGKIFYNKDFKNYAFQDQIMRTCISVTNNIAEGRERGSNKDFIKFLYYSKGSVGEVRSMLYLALDFGYLDQEKFKLLIKDCKNISIKLNNFISVLLKPLK